MIFNFTTLSWPPLMMDGPKVTKWRKMHQITDFLSGANNIKRTIKTSACISGRYLILEVTSTISLLWVLSYNKQHRIDPVYIGVQGTNSGQRYSHTSIFPYIFHIKLQFFKILPWSQLMSDFDNYFINKRRKMHLVYSSYFKNNF